MAGINHIEDGAISSLINGSYTRFRSHKSIWAVTVQDFAAVLALVFGQISQFREFKTVYTLATHSIDRNCLPYGLPHWLCLALPCRWIGSYLERVRAFPVHLLLLFIRDCCPWPYSISVNGFSSGLLYSPPLKKLIDRDSDSYPALHWRLLTLPASCFQSTHTVKISAGRITAADNDVINDASLSFSICIVPGTVRFIRELIARWLSMPCSLNLFPCRGHSIRCLGGYLQGNAANDSLYPSERLHFI